MKEDKLGIALVGLGKYSKGQLGPALKETKHCRLAGIVTGSPEKAEEWKKEFQIPDGNVYSYENFDQIKDNPDIDIIYVVLPNNMHAEYTIRAAKAGKHVICEKPMAIFPEECERMISACKEAGVKLSIGYRLHFDPFNLWMMENGQKDKWGNVKKIIAENGMEVEGGVWRVDKKMSGGGPLTDIGIYCIQGACYTLGEDPIAVTAKEGEKTEPEKFRDVEQSLSWTMEFPSGRIAECVSDYSKKMNLLRAEAESGWFELKPAYEYKALKANTSDGPVQIHEINQQAAQMDDFALCIKNNQETRVPGEMGLRDVKIIQAIYQSMETGRRVEI